VAEEEETLLLSLRQRSLSGSGGSTKPCYDGSGSAGHNSKGY
jgi:hypothetical protein